MKSKKIFHHLLKTTLITGALLGSIYSHAAPILAPLTTKNGQIIDKNGQLVVLQGVSWFGFNTGNHLLHGLWTADFDTMLKKIKSLGFNAVRIPFQFDFIADPNIQPSGINTSCNGQPHSCNLDVPQDSALHAFQWVVQQFTNNGIYVLLDDHYEDDTYTNDPAAWLNGWKKVAGLFKDNPLIGYDLYNEPDSHQITWDGSGSNAPAWDASSLAAMDALYSIDSSKLFLIEGTGQGLLESNWGDGFATDADAAKQASTPKNFFNQLMNKPYVSQVVLSPHVYGPDGTNGNGADESDQTRAFTVWSRLFGYLNNNFLSGNNKQSGFCIDDKTCHLFPIAVGEFGGKFDVNDPWYKKDLATNINLVNFLNQLTSHQANWFYWDWNPNSGNTGGILKNDWKTIDCNKVNFLEENLALKPSNGICS